jgi:hypothetical protein
LQAALFHPRVKRKKNELELLELLRKSSMRAGRRGRAGPATLDSHGGGDQRRLTRTAATLLDGSAYQGHSL